MTQEDGLKFLKELRELPYDTSKVGQVFVSTHPFGENQIYMKQKGKNSNAQHLRIMEKKLKGSIDKSGKPISPSSEKDNIEKRYPNLKIVDVTGGNDWQDVSLYLDTTIARIE